MKSYNNFDMKGRLYSYSLEEKDTDKGTAITGEVTLEVDDKGTTATARFFAYPTYNSGKTNRTYSVLEDMMAGNYKTVVDDADEADWLAMTGNIDVNYFVPRDGAKDIDELARSQKLRGSFVNQNKDHNYQNKWKLDMLITRIDDVEEDAEKNIPHYVRVTGYLIDDYRERVTLVQFQARKEAAMKYILGLTASYDQPYYVSIWGELMKIARTIVRKNAFGEDEVDEYESYIWAITGMAPEAYDFGDESAMTVEQYNEFRENLDAHKKERLEDGNDSAGSGKPDLAF